jgi:hypothetical protein
VVGPLSDFHSLQYANNVRQPLTAKVSRKAAKEGWKKKPGKTTAN